MNINQENKLSPISTAIDCLSTSKFLAMRDTTSAMETTNMQLRQTYYQMAQKHLQMADEWFRLMQGRGWYQVPTARKDLVEQLKQQLQTALASSGVQNLQFQTPPQGIMPPNQAQ